MWNKRWSNLWNKTWNKGVAVRSVRQISAITLAMCLFLAACGGEKAEETSNTPADYTVVQAAVREKAARSSAEYDKEETVYIDASALGEIREITVETRLKCQGEADIEDCSILKDIQNIEGDEEFSVGEAGLLAWENHGEDIRYEGKSEAQPPVTLRISYELDGESIDPQELAGKSGSLRMRFDYENHSVERVNVQGEDIEVCVPFAVFSMVLLPEEVFSDVEVTNGKLMSMGEERVAVGYAYPGLADSLRPADKNSDKNSDGDSDEDEAWEDLLDLPDYVEITAEVTDFALEFTATVISPGTFEDMDMEGLEDAEELLDDLEKLAEASGELVDGTEKLREGANTFSEYLTEYVDAVGAVKEGTAAMQQGLWTLNRNKKKLLQGAEALQAGLEAMSAALGSGQGDGGGQTGSGDGDDRDAPDINMLLADMNNQLNALESAVGGDAEALGRIAALRTDMQLLGGYLAAVEDVANSGKSLAAAVGQLKDGSAQLAEGIKTFNTGIGKLYEGSESLNEGVGELKDAGIELKDGYAELAEGIGTLADGVNTFDEEGIQELSDMADGDIREIIKRFRAVWEADGRYQNYGGIAPQRTGSVRFIIETEEIK